MIKKINKIKNLGLVFSDYVWAAQLPDFKRYNLIYGWNGSGKTTLANLFSVLEFGIFSDGQERFEYEIESGVGVKYKEGESFNQKIRVFNQEYIENNIKIRDGKARAITLVLGDINKDVIEKIEKDKTELKDKKDEFKKISEHLARTEKEKGKDFTEIAKTIYIAITGGAIRNYRKDNAEDDFAKLLDKELLVEPELSNLAIIIKQDSQPPIGDTIEIQSELKSGERKNLDIAFIELIEDTKRLLSETVESKLIERLRDNDDISLWVESGIKLHENHKSLKCEFCGQLLPKNRLSELAKYFNEADKKLKNDIDALILRFSRTSDLIEVLKYPDKARFYNEFQNAYEATCIKFDQEKKILLNSIIIIKDIINNKKAKTTQKVSFEKNLDAIPFINVVASLMDFINKHNKKTLDFEKEKEIATKKLKNHYLSTIFDDINSLNKDINTSKNKLTNLTDGDLSNSDDLGIIGLQRRISENQAKISSTYKACDDINKGLATFLGREELIFEPHKSIVKNNDGEDEEVDDGYLIKRGGKPVHHLSEGEKTAIAFVYFTIHLHDQSFDIKSGIIVIDDPISSLDSNSLFQAFSFLKNAVEEADQVFVLTHNFDFLKLLLNWVKHTDSNQSNYYMIKNHYIDGVRCAYLDKMDKELCKYESEYHYLFKILNKFESDGTIGQSYPIPNIARKVLDTFLLFRVPSGENSYKKLEKIKITTKFDPKKITAIYKFTNDQSHITGSGFDPALVSETQKNVKYLLEMMEDIFPEHYKILQEAEAIT